MFHCHTTSAITAHALRKVLRAVHDVNRSHELFSDGFDMDNLHPEVGEAVAQGTDQLHLSACLSLALPACLSVSLSLSLSLSLSVPLSLSLCPSLSLSFP